MNADRYKPRKRLLPVRVVIASPADAIRERRAAVKALSELNERVAPRLGVTLQAVTWERHAFPALHSVGPQAHIDESLKIRESDLLVAVFRARFGSPVHDAESGTEHEIKLAYEAWKKNGHPQVMMYFLERPVARTEGDIEQLQKIFALKRTFPEALYGTFRPSNFHNTFRDHVLAWLEDTYCRTNSPRLTPPRKIQGTRHLPESSPINKRRSFDEFVADESNQLAFAAVRAVAENPKQTFNPLWLYGFHNLGKTHLLQALVNQLIAKRSDLAVSYVKCERLVREIIACEGSVSLNEALKRYTQPDVLVLDDVHLMFCSDFTQAALAKLVTTMEEEQRQVIISSSLPPMGLFERLMRSQCDWGLMADLQVPGRAFQAKLAALLPVPTTIPVELLDDEYYPMTVNGPSAGWHLNEIGREQAAYVLNAVGFRQRDIARNLKVNVKTVRTWIDQVFKGMKSDLAVAMATQRAIDWCRNHLDL